MVVIENVELACVINLIGFHYELSKYSTSCNTTMTNVGIKRFEDIEKGKNDQRLYRGIELSNGLRALLVSDPTTDKSAASLTVNVGALNDFKELPGLAHFLEHMLFMGSKKYPDENDYHKFVSEHAGHTNAYTAEHQTNFYFDIGPEHLTEGLDRFAQFFLEPLFEESATQREVNAVNSEHEKNIPSDMWRIRQLEKSMSKADHPYNHFSTETLDELETIVSKLFGDVKNKQVKPVIYEHPFGPDELKRRFYVVPVKDIRSLKISFSAPDIVHQYRTAPEHYISQLIGHEGPGSLHSVLRDLGLCNNLSAGLYHVAPGFGFFTISVDLTEEALGCVDGIITLVFQYIKLLKSEGVQKWIFDENSKLEETSFLFKDKESPVSYVTTLSAAMNDYPFKHILSANYIIDEWKPELIVDFLSHLRPDNMKFVVVSKSFEEKADQTEKWYGTKFSVEQIPDELLEAPVHPYVIQETSLSRIWFKQDDEFKLPKLVLQLELFSPIAYLDPGNANLTSMFVHLLKDSLNEYAYAAQLAGLRWDITNTKNGIILGLSGFNEKLPVLLQKIISRMADFQIDPKRFDIIKEMFVRNLRNFETEQPHQHANFFLAYLLTECGWSKQELLSACDSSQYIYEVFNKYHSSSCLCVYFQCSLESTFNNVIIELFAQIIQEPCFNVLRTQTLIENMPDEEFELHKTALATKKLEKPKQLSKLTGRFWKEISSRHYNFDRVELEVKELRSLQKNHILSFYEELVNKCSCKRRKLSIHVVSEVTNPEVPKDIEDAETRIEDVTVFKNSLGLCPLPKAYINIAPVGTKSKL
ncbi:hypothetical protein V9T40_001864 [Parthenolecanium corni]|uniref:Insulin-degrading enzyme n=1 Tax=Parthenolecanium corni TaxID=536013 RepID=A0AAN9Y3A4_9HEMI